MSDLDSYRKAIDEIDSQILTLIAKRQSQVIKVAQLKAESGESVFQPDRHNLVLEKIKQSAIQNGVSPTMAFEIWKLIMDESIRLQNDIVIDKNK